MKKSLLALSIAAAAASQQAGAFMFDTGDDFQIRWDNTLKYNLAVRAERQNRDVYAAAGAVGPLADDSDLSRDRGNIVSNRVDVLSEFDFIWRDNYGFRVSAAGWYDNAYDDSDNNQKGYLPNGFAYDATWGALSVRPGKYTNAAEDLHYFGGELLDAFAFANFDVGNAAIGVRAGRHTLYWGQSLLGTGALLGIAGGMAALDISKAYTVPGSEAKELFLPNNKVSTVMQLTDNFTVSAFYAFEHVVNRFPEEGSYLSPIEVLTEDSQFLTLVPGTATTPRTGFRVIDDKFKDSGEWGVNLQYTIEAWELETQLVYISATDRNVSGLYGTGINPAVVDPVKRAKWLLPWDQGGSNANVVGYYGWVYTNEIDTYGLSLSKQMFDISFGLDLVYRDDAPLNPDFTPSLLANPGTTPGTWSGDGKYPGARGDWYALVINGLGLLDGHLGIWDGGQIIVEATASMLDSFTEREQYANTKIHEDRVVSAIAATFRPTWYQVFPGWDMTIPMAVSYTIDGEQSPMSNGGNEEVGNGSVGIEFDVNQMYNFSLKYNAFFGPAANGTAGLVKDRDNVSFTAKATF